MDFIDLKTQYQRLKVDVDAGIARVLAHCQFILGPEVAELAEKAAYTGARHCITVANGTDALQIALMVGVPARQIGWMSEFGEQLDLPTQGQGEAVCQHTGARYVLQGAIVAKQTAS